MVMPVGAVDATPLTRHLSLAEPAAGGPVDAFRLARAKYLAGQRIDMQQLAVELGVGRATLFRWVGNRDLLMSEILWSFAEPAFHRVIAQTRGRGATRIARVSEQFANGVIASEPFGRYLTREPEAALRLLTTSASVVQSRVVAAMHELLAEEVRRGALDPPMALPDLAYVIVRIGESFVYADLITGDTPDAAKAAAAIAALLGKR